MHDCNLCMYVRVNNNFVRTIECLTMSIENAKNCVKLTKRLWLAEFGIALILQLQNIQKSETAIAR